MKNKYTLTIAGMEINVITEKEEDDVEYIVGMLDRRMRDIILKSKRCSKNEAALLCALDFCSEKIELKAALEALNEEHEEAASTLKEVNEKLDMYRKNSDRMEKDINRLEAENKKLRKVLSELKANGTQVEIPDTFEDDADSDKSEKDESSQTEDKNAKNNRSRVGSMFDLLTFSDI